MFIEGQHRFYLLIKLLFFWDNIKYIHVFSSDNVECENGSCFVLYSDCLSRTPAAMFEHLLKSRSLEYVNPKQESHWKLVELQSKNNAGNNGNVLAGNLRNVVQQVDVWTPTPPFYGPEPSVYPLHYALMSLPRRRLGSIPWNYQLLRTMKPTECIANKDIKL